MPSSRLGLTRDGSPFAPYRSGVFAALACGFVISTTVPCRGDEPATSPGAPAPAPPVAPPDVVILSSGGMLRGTISEMDPKGDVVIQLATGEVRRVPMSDVKYAGPSANMPKSEASEPAEAEPAKKKTKKKSEPRPKVVVEADEAALTLSAKQPDVTFHLKTHSGTFEGTGTGYSSQGGTATAHVSGTSTGYTVICTAPCAAALPTGTHRMALSVGGGSTVEVDESVVLRGPSKLEGNYQSKSGVRVGGWLVMFGGVIAGSAIMFSGDPSSDDMSKFYLGLGLVVVGTGVGYWMTTIKDSAEVKVSPQGQARSVRLRQAGSSWANGFVL